jgi:hypothetical protein
LTFIQGIVASAIAYYVQGLVIKKTGPVFASAFSPLMMIVVAAMGSFILSEKIYLGGVVGAVVIVVGLYSVLWGKHKEKQEKEADAKTTLPMASKGDGGAGAGGGDAAVFVVPGAAGNAAACVGHDVHCNKANGVRSSSDGRGAAAPDV